MVITTNRAMQRLGNQLVKQGLITQEQFDNCLLSVSEDRDLVSILREKDLVSNDDLGETLGSLHGLPYVNVLMYDIPTEILENVGEATARRYHIIPVDRHENTITLALSDPANIYLLQDLRLKTGLEIEPVLCLDHLIEEAIDKFYHQDQTEQFLEELEQAREEVELIEERAEDEDEIGEDQAPVVKWVHVTLQEAIRMRVSDVHIEPEEHTVRVRVRIDGKLVEMRGPPKRMHAAIVSRIKIMSNLDIAEKRKPQDGRFKLKAGNKTVDFRVSVLPCVHGEKVVMRLLDKSSLAFDLTKLGFEADSMEKFERAIHRPFGMLIVTGPTGSGKSTTLYSALSRINQPDTNIMTVEDPVEFQIEGINQVQVNEYVGLTFSTALRSFLRQDPDVIMLGEVRDHETGSIAVKSALTGHLVLSTLHTNDAPSSINRLIDMGIEPFLISAALIMVIAQRLSRRICENCRVAYEPPEEDLELLGVPRGERPSIQDFFRGTGCPTCNDFGYRGRCALYEVMEMNETLGNAVVSRKTTSEIKRLARRTGMRTLREAGVRKIIEGTTTVSEVLAVTFEDEILEGE